MSLLCRLGWHVSAGAPRWHQGLYIGRCARCGRDIVRIGRDRWRAPSGFQVLRSNSGRDGGGADANLPRAEARPAQPAPAEDRADKLAPAAPPQLPTSQSAAAPVDEPPAPDAGAAEPRPRRSWFARSPAEEVPGSRHAPEAVAAATAAALDPGEEEAPSSQPEERRADARLMWLGAALAGAGLVAGVALALLFVATFAARDPAPPPPRPSGGAIPAAIGATIAPPAAPQPAAAAPAAPEPVMCPPPHQRGGDERDGRILLSTRDGSWVAISRPGTPCWTVSVRGGRRRR
jgi:hypothetical protein